MNDPVKKVRLTILAEEYEPGRLEPLDGGESIEVEIRSGQTTEETEAIVKSTVEEFLYFCNQDQSEADVQIDLSILTARRSGNLRAEPGLWIVTSIVKETGCVSVVSVEEVL